MYVILAQSSPVYVVLMLKGRLMGVEEMWEMEMEDTFVLFMVRCKLKLEKSSITVFGPQSEHQE